MSRLFDGVDDQMVYPIPASGGTNFTFGTILIVAKIVNTTDTAWLSFIEGQTGAGVVHWGMGRRSTGNIYYANQATLNDAVAVQDADGWCVIAITKTTGTTAPVHYKIVVGGATTTATNSMTFANSTSTASGNLRIGGNSDFANIKVAAAAVWVGTVLTQAQLQGIASAATTQSIADLSPTWLVDDSDAFATDLIGTQDRGTLVGTTDDADDPAGWTYFGGGGTNADVAAVPADATGDLPAPTVTTPDATVLAPVADALGSFPSSGMVISVDVVLTAPMAATGTMHAPTVTGTSAGNVTSPVADATGDLTTPTVTADATAVSPVADATGDLTAPAVTAGSIVTSPVASAAGDLLTPIQVGEPQDRFRLGEVNTGATEVASRATRRTGANEPAHFTGAAEPAHNTGGTEQITVTGAAEVVLV